MFVLVQYYWRLWSAHCRSIYKYLKIYLYTYLSIYVWLRPILKMLFALKRPSKHRNSNAEEAETEAEAEA